METIEQYSAVGNRTNGPAQVSKPPQHRLQTRRASADDVPALIELTKQSHEESRLSDIRFSEEKARRAAQAALENDPRRLVAVVEYEGSVAGAAYAHVGEYYLGEDELITTVQGIFVHPAIRKTLLSGRVSMRLFKAIRQWSDHMGARHVVIHVTSGLHAGRTDRLLKKLGGRPLGGNYLL